MRHGDRPTAVPDFWRDVTLTGRCDVTELCFGLCNLCFDATSVVRNLQLLLELGELKAVSLIRLAKFQFIGCFIAMPIILHHLSCHHINRITNTSSSSCHPLLSHERTAPPSTAANATECTHVKPANARRNTCKSCKIEPMHSSSSRFV